MKYKTLLLIVILISLSAGLPAQTRPLAINDLTIHSDNTKYTYIGKGIAEMIAVELRKSPGIQLIEREKRTQLVEEMSFSLSGLTDSEQQLEIGKMLSARYVIFGDIIDMDREMLISLRMIEVETGEIVWNEKLTEELSRYDYISGYFAESILSYMDAEVSSTTVVKAEQTAEKSEEVVVALSRAIDHYDKQETEKARKELGAAKALDPESETVEYYLSKLVVNTTRFKVLMEPYFSYQNPAFLGIIRTDMFFFSGTIPPAYTITNINKNQVEGINMTSFGADKYISEQTWNGYEGYAFPIGSRMGLRITTTHCGFSDRRWEGSYDDGPVTTTGRNSMGGIIDLGYALKERWALGFGAGLFSMSKEDMGPKAAIIAPDRAVLSLNLGVLYRRPDESLIVDSRLGYNSDTYETIDEVTLLEDKEVMSPILLENTLTLSLNDRRTFLLVKQINNVCFDRTYYYATIMPAVEHFLTDWVSFRGGIEGSFSILNDSAQIGYGILGGFTLRYPKWGLECDFNVTYRLRPSRAVEELLYKDLVILMNITLNDVFISRE